MIYKINKMYQDCPAKGYEPELMSIPRPCKAALTHPLSHTKGEKHECDCGLSGRL